MTIMQGENQLKKQKNLKISNWNLESKNLSMHLRHHCTNSRQSSSDLLIARLPLSLKSLSFSHRSSQEKIISNRCGTYKAKNFKF